MNLILVENPNTNLNAYLCSVWISFWEDNLHVMLQSRSQRSRTLWSAPGMRTSGWDWKVSQQKSLLHLCMRTIKPELGFSSSSFWFCAECRGQRSMWSSYKNISSDTEICVVRLEWLTTLCSIFQRFTILCQLIIMLQQFNGQQMHNHWWTRYRSLIISLTLKVSIATAWTLYDPMKTPFILDFGACNGKNEFHDLLFSLNCQNTTLKNKILVLPNVFL